MIIGIDFDNTIIDYGLLFSQIADEKGWKLSKNALTKAQVKQDLLSQDGNDFRWQELQSLVYGGEIDRAKPFQYCLAFMQEVIKNNDNLYIVSHKTEYSNYDKSIELIKPAIDWLKKNKIVGSDALIAEKNVFFYADRNKKINQIKQLQCDIFIDDLAVVLLDQTFPPKTFGLLFSDKQKNALVSAQKWENILQFYRLSTQYDRQWLIDASLLLKSLIIDISPANQGGNNIVQIIHCLNGMKYLIKRTKKEKSHCLKNEYNALSLLQKHHISCVAKAIDFSEKRAELIQSYLVGKPIKQIKDAHLNEVIKFILSLQALDQNQIQYINSSDHREKYHDYINAINRRWALLNKDIVELTVNYSIFNKVATLLDQIKPLKEHIIEQFTEQVCNEKLNIYQPFPDIEKIFNPSDFGFHNILETKKGKLNFVDFEYFVYDDKAKLVCDFIHHAGHQLSIEQKLYFFKQLNKKNFFTPALKRRIKLLINMVGLEWLLIILNIAQKDKLEQKIHANPNVSVEQIIENQYNKAKNKLLYFQKNIGDNKELFTLGIEQKELYLE